jgi:hypothetical protein
MEQQLSTDTAGLRAGSRLKSQVCTTEVVVVRPGTRPLALMCGGVPMVAREAPTAQDATAVPELMLGTQLGKRYAHPEDDQLELLVTAGGAGSLSDGGTPLVLKAPKPLPASD